MYYFFFILWGEAFSEASVGNVQVLHASSTEAARSHGHQPAKMSIFQILRS